MCSLGSLRLTSLWRLSSLCQQICQVLSDQGAVFIVNLDRELLFHIQARLAQPMSKSILIDFLQMPMPVVDMNVISRLPNKIAQLVNVFQPIPLINNRKEPKEHKEHRERGVNLLL